MLSDLRGNFERLLDQLEDAVLIFGRDRRLVQVSVAMTGIVLVVQLMGFIPHGAPIF